jgi:hypothetical protein
MVAHRLQSSTATRKQKGATVRFGPAVVVIMTAIVLPLPPAEARRRHPAVDAESYPRGWALRRARARTVLERFGYTKQATILDPGGKAHFVLHRANNIFPRVAERYTGPGGKQWVLTATGTGYPGPRQGRHDIRVAPSGRRSPNGVLLQLEVGHLGLQPAPRRWDRPASPRTDSVPALAASMKLPDGQIHRLTLERVGKNGWRTPAHLHLSLGPHVSFQIDARGDIHALSVRTPEGGFSQLGDPRGRGGKNQSVLMGRRR